MLQSRNNILATKSTGAGRETRTVTLRRNLLVGPLTSDIHSFPCGGGGGRGQGRGSWCRFQGRPVMPAPRYLC